MQKISSYKLLIFFFLSCLISGSIIFYLSLEWEKAYNHNTSHIENIGVIKFNLAEGHLWFEELISGDESLTYSGVEKFFLESKKRARYGYVGHDDGEIKLSPYESERINIEFKDLEKKINEFMNLAKTRYQNISKGVTGGKLDQEFDSIFEGALKVCDELTKDISNSSKNERNKLIRLQNYMLLFWFIIVILISKRIFSLIKLEINLKDELKKNNEALEFNVQERTKELLIAKDKAEAASRAKSDFLATMSHEIRTPLNGILGFSSLLQESELNDNQRDYIEIINNSGNGLLHIINDILDFSKIEAGKIDLEYSYFNIYELVEQVIDTVSSSAIKKSIEIVYYVDESVPDEIELDYTRIRQILINLLGNAIKFTEKGSITLLIDYGDEKVHFSVKDTGIGINQNKIGSLFNAFTQEDSSTTRKFGGTGLGLAISKKLTLLMGGDIRVESELGKGSNFLFYVHPKNVRASSGIRNEQLQGKKILIIDDNEINLKLYRTFFKSWGSGESLYLNRADSEKVKELITKHQIDIIITDYNMPEINGVQLFKKLSQEKLPPIILLTSSYYEEEKKDVERIFNRVLFKPISSSRLKRSVCDILDIKDEKSDEIEEISPLDLKVLLVEDNLINQKIALKFLEQFGVKPEIANNGQEAIKLATKEFDIILMDIQMPVMDGIEATQIIRKLKLEKDPFIVALTANVFTEQKNEAIEAGMNHFLSKPIKKMELYEMLKEIGLKLS